MEQLTMGDILNLVSVLKKSGMTAKEINSLPVYIGDDDELNGVHTSWYCQMIDHSDDDEYTRELINENRCNIKLADDVKAILIS